MHPEFVRPLFLSPSERGWTGKAGTGEGDEYEGQASYMPRIITSASGAEPFSTIGNPATTK